MALLPLLQFTEHSFEEVVINANWNSDWGPVTIYALLISLFVVALAYMIAEILRSPQLNAWAKNELFEFIVSAIIIGNLFLGLTLMNTLVYNLTGGRDHFDMANDYLEQLVREPSLKNLTMSIMDYIQGTDLNEGVGDINKAYLKIWLAESMFGVLGSFQTAFILSPGPILAFLRLGFSPLAGLSQLSNSLITINDMVGVMLLAFIAQKAVLSFFQQTMFKLFLPLGVVLRAFPLSRKLGSTIIALAITCYVVYPLTLVMNMGIYDATPKYALQTDLVDMNTVISRLGASKEGQYCESPLDCNGAPCLGNRCGNKFGMDCTTRDDCEGAPCNCGGSPCDCSVSSCTCQHCPATGDSCAADSQCCGVCFPDPDTGAKSCQIFKVEPLVKRTYPFKEYMYGPTCSTPDPETCFTDFDCPCAMASGVSPACMELPDGSKRCAVPIIDQKDLSDILQTSPATPMACQDYFLKCIFVDLYNQAVATHSRVQWLDFKVISYFFMPTVVPELGFEWLVRALPDWLWAPVVASALGIIDIIICVTFFRSLSESIGGDPTIWGLSRAV